MARGLKRAWVFNRRLFDASIAYPDEGVFAQVSFPVRVGRGTNYDGIDDSHSLAGSLPLGASPVVETLSIAVLFRSGGVYGAANAGGYVFALADTGGTNNPLLGLSYASAASLGVTDRNLAGTSASTSGVSFDTTGRLNVATFSRLHDSSRALYVNGTGVTTNTTTVDYSVTPFNRIGFACVARTTIVAWGKVTLEAVFLWHRALTAEDAAWLYREPWVMFWPRPVRTMRKAGAAGTLYTESVVDTFTLADALALVQVLGLSILDMVSLSETLAHTGQAHAMFSDAMVLQDATQAMFRRTQTGAAVDWRNPARLAETLWTPRGTCACGLGHVGPQGCNAFIGVDVSDPGLVLSDTLTVEVSAPPAPTRIDDDQYLILEGFEHPQTFVDGTWAGHGVYMPENLTSANSISTSVRAGSTTAGRCLQCVYGPGVEAGVQWCKINSTNTVQYFRAYVQIVSYTNTYGSGQGYPLLGWFDSTGYRYWIGLEFPAAGGLGTFKIGNIFGDHALGTFLPVVGTWYRLEFVCELLASGTVMNTAWVYDGDTMTLLDHWQQSEGGQALGGFPFVGWVTQSGIVPNTLMLRFDDVRIEELDVTPPVVATQTPLRGPGGVWALVPAGVGSSEWTPVGTSANYQAVTEYPVAVFDDDTTYVQSSGTTALSDNYPVTPYPALPSGVITAVLVRVRTRKESGALNPTGAALYQDARGTLWEGSQLPARQTDYTNYPNSQSTSALEPVTRLGVYYPVPLNTGYATQQAMGIRRIASSATETLRCTSVWGNMDVVI